MKINSGGDIISTVFRSSIIYNTVLFVLVFAGTISSCYQHPQFFLVVSMVLSELSTGEKLLLSRRMRFYL